MATTLGLTGITFPDATTQTTAASGGVTSLNGQTGAIVNTTYGSIGSYVIAAENDYTTLQERLPNVSVAGSSLYRATSTPTTATSFGLNGIGGSYIQSGLTISLSLSGTWLRLTRSKNGTGITQSALNLYVRTA